MSSHFEVACPHCRGDVGAEYAEQQVYDLTCPHCGQVFCLFVRRQRFEVLFELGTSALLSGYAREAVSSFAAALERCFEFYVRAYALEQAAAQDLSLEEAQGRLEATWKLVDRQSERQVGMLALAYLLREGRPPDFLRPQALGSEFRNAVIHRGALPRRAEVDDYAAQVFGLIDHLLSVLGEATLQVQALDELEFARHFAQLPPGTPAVTQEHPGVFRTRMHGHFHVPDAHVPNAHVPEAGPAPAQTWALGAGPPNRTFTVPHPAPAEVFRAALRSEALNRQSSGSGAGRPLNPPHVAPVGWTWPGHLRGVPQTGGTDSPAKDAATTSVAGPDAGAESSGT